MLGNGGEGKRGRKLNNYINHVLYWHNGVKSISSAFFSNLTLNLRNLQKLRHVYKQCNIYIYINVYLYIINSDTPLMQPTILLKFLFDLKNILKENFKFIRSCRLA